MRRGLILLLALMPLTAQLAAPSRGEIDAVERGFDQKLQRYSVEAPIEVLGLTRGIYLTGYGVAFTTEVSLVPTPGISPFRPAFTKDDIARVKAAKAKRLPAIRGLMRDAMVSSAGSMDRLPMDEQVVFGVFFFYNAWEDSSGLPHCVTMQARRRALLDVATNRQPRTALDSIIQVREE